MRPNSIIVLIVALGLSGCITVVSVHGVDPSDVQVIPVIGSAKIASKDGKAISIDAWTIGIGQSCGVSAVGLAAAHCVEVDPRGCPVAIIKSTGPVDEKFWGHVAKETRADCPEENANGTPKTQPR